MKLLGFDVSVTRAPISQAEPSAVNPTGEPFSPGTPLVPYTPIGATPLTWAPPVGYNLTYSPDKRPGIRHTELRALADACYGIRIVMEDFKKQLRGLRWDVVPGEGGSESRAAAIKVMLLRPDGALVWTDWLNALIEDVLVIGACAIGKLRMVNGQPVGLRLVDAATIVPIVTSVGTSPLPPSAAYYQYAYGLPYREYSSDDLVYRPFNRRTWTPYGFGPLEQTLLLVVQQINRAMYYTRWYTEGNLPPAFITLPESWSEGKIETFQKYLNVLMQGNTEQKQKALVMPAGTDVIPARQDESWSYDFDEFLMRVFAWALGVSPVNIVKQNTLGQGSEGMSSSADASGIQPYQDFVEELLDDYIQHDLGEPALEFEWVEEQREDKAYQLLEDEGAVKIGLRTINEVRQSRGEEPYDDPLADEPLVLTATGYVPLAPPEPAPIPDVLAPFAGQNNPPVPPGEEEVPDEGADEQEQTIEEQVKADLSRWRRKAARDLRADRAPRPFKSDVIPPEVRAHVEGCLCHGDLAGAFDMDKVASGKIKGLSTSVRAKAAEAAATPVYRALLERIARHYAQEAEAALAAEVQNDD